MICTPPYTQAATEKAARLEAEHGRDHARLVHVIDEALTLRREAVRSHATHPRQIQSLSNPYPHPIHPSST